MMIAREEILENFEVNSFQIKVLTRVPTLAALFLFSISSAFASSSTEDKSQNQNNLNPDSLPEIKRIINNTEISTQYGVALAKTQDLENALRIKDLAPKFLKDENVLDSGDRLEIKVLDEEFVVVININEGANNSLERVTNKTAKINNKSDPDLKNNPAKIVSRTELKDCYSLNLKTGNLEEIFELYKEIGKNSPELIKDLAIYENYRKNIKKDPYTYSLVVDSYTPNKKMLEELLPLLNAKYNLHGEVYESNLQNEHRAREERVIDYRFSKEFSGGRKNIEKVKVQNLDLTPENVNTPAQNQLLKLLFKFRQESGLCRGVTFQQSCGINLTNGIFSNTQQLVSVVYDLDDNKPLVSVNPDEPVELASIVKVFFSAAFYTAYQNGTLINGKPLEITGKDLVEDKNCLQHSNNQSTDYKLSRLGGPKNAEKILKEAYPGMFNSIDFNSFIRDGSGLNNRASARDIVNIFKLIHEKKIPYSEHISYLNSLPSTTRTNITEAGRYFVNFNISTKTGTNREGFGEAGLIIDLKTGKSYVVILITEKDGTKRGRYAEFKNEILADSKKNTPVEEKPSLVTKIAYSKPSVNLRYRDLVQSYWEAITAINIGYLKPQAKPQDIAVKVNK